MIYLNDLTMAVFLEWVKASMGTGDREWIVEALRSEGRIPFPSRDRYLPLEHRNRIVASNSDAPR